MSMTNNDEIIKLFRGFAGLDKEIRDRWSKKDPVNVNLHPSCNNHAKTDTTCEMCLVRSVMYIISMNRECMMNQGYEPVWRHKKTCRIIHEDPTFIGVISRRRH